MDIIRFDEVKKIWFRIARNHSGDMIPDFELEIYKKMLNLFHVGPCYYYICNIARVEIEHVSGPVGDILGIDPDQFSVEYVYDHIHPGDKARFVAHEQKVTAFFNGLPPDKVLKYKVSYDYRLMRADGSYTWILHQVVTIQSDENGAVIRVLGVHTDIAHLKADHQPSGLSFIGLDGEPSYYNVPVDQVIVPVKKTFFTKREQEILRLIIEGKSSDQIAELLFISRHTVNTHRKNILHKSGCPNWIELASRAILQGWV